ncbi:hypothetical protein HDU98_012108 [Podochytrium sp. JEL0797]|nr:hypothetical protein HDU98_012108 [Podochytrium sp. JEL0797]
MPREQLGTSDSQEDNEVLAMAARFGASSIKTCASIVQLQRAAKMHEEMAANLRAQAQLMAAYLESMVVNEGFSGMSIAASPTSPVSHRGSVAALPPTKTARDSATTTTPKTSSSAPPTPEPAFSVSPTPKLQLFPRRKSKMEPVPLQVATAAPESATPSLVPTLTYKDFLDEQMRIKEKNRKERESTAATSCSPPSTQEPPQQKALHIHQSTELANRDPSISAMQKALHPLVGSTAATTAATGVTYVVGNEAVDVDSFASSVLLAVYLSATSPSGEHFVPLVPLVETEFSQRGDSAAALRFAGLCGVPLLFCDALSRSTLLTPNALSKQRIALADHNAPAASLCKLFTAPLDIVAIVDHHKDENPLQKCDLLRIVEPTASAASLVALLFKRDLPTLLDEQAAKLLLCPIVLDTVNFTNPRCTHKDTEARDFLVEIILKHDPAFNQSILFDALQKAKFDTASLSCVQLLNRDYKQTHCIALNDPSVVCELGIASVTTSLSNLLARSEQGSFASFRRALTDFVAEKRLDILLVMTAFEAEGGVFCREVLLLSTLAENGASERLLSELLGQSDLALQPMDLLPGQSGGSGAASAENGLRGDSMTLQYFKLDPKMSRKLLQPIVVPIIQSLL